MDQINNIYGHSKGDGTLVWKRLKRLSEHTSLFSIFYKYQSNRFTGLTLIYYIRVERINIRVNVLDWQYNFESALLLINLHLVLNFAS